ncbi:hypothetical protein [Kribbella sp. NPDC048928]|uniref:YqeB family protein n=1 Tax=Kribbella sp. NPDC048928 TaxID=3364111 RepID=UPI003715203F
MGSTTGTPESTVIGHSTGDKVLLFGGLPLAGLVLGFFLPRLADWAAGLSWVPFQGVLRLIAAWDSWWVVVVCVVVGLVAGVVLAGMALDDTLKVTITSRSVEFLKHQKTVTVPREKVSVAFLDGKEIVLQDASSRELAREKHDQLKSETPKIAAAFRAHGYPWSEAGDPHSAEFRRWIEDNPDLPPAVNAILKVRSRAFDDGDKGKADLRELRTELTNLGYTIKDKDRKQYWRPTP